MPHTFVFPLLVLMKKQDMYPMIHFGPAGIGHLHHLQITTK